MISVVGYPTLHHFITVSDSCTLWKREREEERKKRERKLVRRETPESIDCSFSNISSAATTITTNNNNNNSGLFHCRFAWKVNLNGSDRDAYNTNTSCNLYPLTYYIYWSSRFTVQTLSQNNAFKTYLFLYFIFFLFPSTLAIFNITYCIS